MSIFFADELFEDNILLGDYCIILPSNYGYNIPDYSKTIYIINYFNCICIIL